MSLVIRTAVGSELIESDDLVEAYMTEAAEHAHEGSVIASSPGGVILARCERTGARVGWSLTDSGKVWVEEHGGFDADGAAVS